VQHEPSALSVQHNFGVKNLSVKLLYKTKKLKKTKISINKKSKVKKGYMPS